MLLEQPDVATVSKLSVAELEAAIQRAVVKDSAAARVDSSDDDASSNASEHNIEIDIICGGSPCVNFVGNAAYSKTIRSLHTLKDDDP